MNSRFGKAISLFTLCLVVPMGIVRGQTTTTVTCTDGTTSTSVGKGACSGHGGVKKAPTKTAAPTAGKTKAPTKTDAKTTKPDAKTAAPAATKVAPTKAPAKTPTKAAKPDTKAAPTKTPPPAADKAAARDASNKDPKNATAQCVDGTYSHAATHTGACSGHGGVLKFLK